MGSVTFKFNFLVGNSNVRYELLVGFSQVALCPKP